MTASPIYSTAGTGAKDIGEHGFLSANCTGKLIAGGYNKAIAMDADSVANRVLIFQYPSKEAIDKDWKANIELWEMRAAVRKLADFHAIGVEGVEQK